MAKWRDVKHKKNSSLENTTTEDSLIICASIPSRIKAFIVDMFMIMMPLAYFTTYIFMDGKDDFQGSQEARWTLSLTYGLIIIIFWIAKGQTPGLKAYSLKLLNEKTKEKISLPKAILRYIAFLFSSMTILLAFLPFLRKDKKTFQDLVSGTIVIDIDKK
ncbi:MULTISPECIES: RDD family protein [Arcobacteraceae]|uniref:RDD family protein n=1 Tax=Aliarcobacter butzleri TaxID=28197 RepID=A0AAW7PUD1_9BACT|nr:MULTISPECIES: RDD family protein [Arcobacteraceae]MCT7553293.1 RDD family protein [Aliarcobacter butzleri]MCT7587321.1 RDD family protein [Aliarcobacter butzleri]MCT7910165.1 RDD family protein [Arcobacter lacus]MCT7912512.1 RDD family protein [Arcobacter lacus]MDN5064807.1 RDD family protein [Aliarcobacter butzleri]